MSNRTKQRIASVVAFLGGVLFVVMGVIDFLQVKNFPEVSAVVTAIEYDTAVDSDGAPATNSIVHVSYTVDGKEYNELLQEAPTDVAEGATVTARYNPQKPEYITGATKGSGVVRIVFGAVFVLVGIVSFFFGPVLGRNS